MRMKNENCSWREFTEKRKLWSRRKFKGSPRKRIGTNNIANHVEFIKQKKHLGFHCLKNYPNGNEYI